MAQSQTTKHKSSNKQSGPVKENRKMTKTKRASQDNSSSTDPKNPIMHIKSTIAFKALISARIGAAIWSHITDCDETFNYWEPLHYLLYGKGLQTWEYSPDYALRSYFYLLVHGVPVWIYKELFNPNPLLIFYMIRFILGVSCAIVETQFYKGVCREFGVHIGRVWLIFQLFSSGMFISSAALLPSSFSMYFGSLALSTWWYQKYKLTVLFIAISSLLGWPFAVIIGLPIAIDLLFVSRLFRTFMTWIGISLLTILLPMAIIDSIFFGKLTIAPLNLIIYNVFTSHGPNLYGVEPLSFYFINGFLNYNFVWLLAMVTPVLLVMAKYLVPAKSRSTLVLPYYLSLAPLYLWLAVFIAQPHKEERFLFPIYPMISLCGAISLDIIQKLFFRLKILILKLNATTHYLDHSMFIAAMVMVLSTVAGMSRIYSLYENYHAPLEVMMELGNISKTLPHLEKTEYNVCVGKDWYRYPSSFFLPHRSFSVRFLRSEFKGILPAYYEESEEATRKSHSYFNDQNLENEFMYFDNYKKCHFLLDLALEGKSSELEPNYASRTKEWTIVKSKRFLHAEKSHKFFRAFYIPFITNDYVTYGNMHLLKNKKIKN